MRGCTHTELGWKKAAVLLNIQSKKSSFTILVKEDHLPCMFLLTFLLEPNPISGSSLGQYHPIKEHPINVWDHQNHYRLLSYHRFIVQHPIKVIDPDTNWKRPTSNYISICVMLVFSSVFNIEVGKLDFCSPSKVDCFLMHKNGWNHHGTWWVSAPGFDKCWYIKPFNGRRPRRWNCMDCDAAGNCCYHVLDLLASLATSLFTSRVGPVRVEWNR